MNKAKNILKANGIEFTAVRNELLISRFAVTFDLRQMLNKHGFNVYYLDVTAVNY